MCLNIYIYICLFTHIYPIFWVRSPFLSVFHQIFTGLHCDSWAAVNRAPRVFQRPCASLPRIVAAPKKRDCFIEYQRDMMGI